MSVRWRPEKDDVHRALQNLVRTLPITAVRCIASYTATDKSGVCLQDLPSSWSSHRGRLGNLLLAYDLMPKPDGVPLTTRSRMMHLPPVQDVQLDVLILALV
jgi:hypothetical protein